MNKRYRYGKTDFTTPKSRIAGAFYFLISWLVGGYVIGKYLFRPDPNKSNEENASDYVSLRARFDRRLFGAKAEEGDSHFKRIKITNFRIVKEPETKEESEGLKE